MKIKRDHLGCEWEKQKNRVGQVANYLKDEIRKTIWSLIGVGKINTKRLRRVSKNM